MNAKDDEIIEKITVDLHTRQGETYVEIIGFAKSGNFKLLIKESNHGSWAADMRKFGVKGYYDRFTPFYVGKTFGFKGE